jgi:large subunit ribosomal protein L23
MVTEQSISRAQLDHKYSFYVNRDANKIEIRNAVEKLFKVKVTNINTVRVKGKMKRVGHNTGRTAERKKAIVTLREGDKIEIFEGLLS